MIFTVLKGGFVKKGPKTVYYRDFSKYNKKPLNGTYKEICQIGTEANVNMEPLITL